VRDVTQFADRHGFGSERKRRAECSWLETLTSTNDVSPSLRSTTNIGKR